VRWVAFDTETHAIVPGLLAPPLVCVSWYDGTNSGLLDKTRGLAAIRAFLEDPGLRLVGLNVSYDLAAACAADPSLMPLVWAAYDADRVWDVSIWEMLRKIAAGTFQWCPFLEATPWFSMAELVAEWFGADLSADKAAGSWRTRYHELDGIPIASWPAEAVRYPIADAVWTGKLYERQGPIPDFLPQVRAAWSLHLAGCWGLRTDGEAVRKLGERLIARVVATLPRLVAAGLCAPRRAFPAWHVPALDDYKRNLGEFKRRVVADLGPRMDADRYTTGKGNVQYGEEVLFLTDDPDLLAYAAISKDVGELSRNVPVLERGTVHPINPRFRPIVVSGRAGVRSKDEKDGEATGAQTQNLPRRKGVRECHVPRDGWAFVNTDVSAAELVGLAQVCLDLFGWSKLAEVLRAGLDPHKVTASNMTGQSYEVVAAAVKAGEAWAVDARQLCKIANFGFPGALSPATMVEWARDQTRREDGTYPVWIQSFDEGRSRWLREVWLSSYPEVDLLFREGKRVTRAGGGKATFVQHRSGRVRGGCRFTAWCNTGFQGIVADAAKLWLWHVQREAWNVPTSPLYGARVVNFIHDEIMTEAPIARVHEVAERQAALGVEAMLAFMPYVPAKVGATSSLRWYKGAEPVHVEGRLVPGRPVEDGGRTRWVAA